MKRFQALSGPFFAIVFGVAIPVIVGISAIVTAKTVGEFYVMAHTPSVGAFAFMFAFAAGFLSNLVAVPLAMRSLGKDIATRRSYMGRAILIGGVAYLGFGFLLLASESSRVAVSKLFDGPRTCAIGRECRDSPW
jgi:cytochrome c biogenesis protein CcdA